MNLHYRKILKDDIPFVNEVRNLYAEEYLHDSRKFTLYESYDWFEKQKPNYWIILKDDAKIGYFRLSNHSEKNKNIYIGADIAPEFRGKGYAKIAYKEFISFLFETYDLHKISLEVLETNIIAKSLYENLGFKFEGKKRQEVFKNGNWVDSIIMSILRFEYNTSKVQNNYLK